MKLTPATDFVFQQNNNINNIKVNAILDKRKTILSFFMFVSVFLVESPITEVMDCTSGWFCLFR